GSPIYPIEAPSVKTNIFPTLPVQPASPAPMPVLVPVPANAPQPSAQVAARWLPTPPPADAPMSAPASTMMEKTTLPLSRSGDPTISNQRRMVKTITIHTRPAQSASLAPMPEPVPVAAPTPQPSVQVATRWVVSAPPADQSGNVVASAELMPIAQTPLAKLESKKIEAVKLAGAGLELTKVAVSAPVKAHAHDEWLIQIGAFDHEDEAKQHLGMAQLKMRKELATAHPLTERVQKGDKVLYRARF